MAEENSTPTSLVRKATWKAEG